MNIFLVNKEFAVSLSTTSLYLNDGDIVWIKKDPQDKQYIYRVGYNIKDFGNGIKYYEMMVPFNLNYDIYVQSNFKRKSIKEAVTEGYMSDITTQYNRDKNIDVVWKSLEAEI